LERFASTIKLSMRSVAGPTSASPIVQVTDSVLCAAGKDSFGNPRDRVLRPCFDVAERAALDEDREHLAAEAAADVAGWVSARSCSAICTSTSSLEIGPIWSSISRNLSGRR